MVILGFTEMVILGFTCKLHWINSFYLFLNKNKWIYIAHILFYFIFLLLYFAYILIKWLYFFRISPKLYFKNKF